AAAGSACGRPDSARPRPRPCHPADPVPRAGVVQGVVADPVDLLRRPHGRPRRDRRPPPAGCPLGDADRPLRRRQDPPRAPGHRGRRRRARQRRPLRPAQRRCRSRRRADNDRPRVGADRGRRPSGCRAARHRLLSPL
ncbi:MAG: hypothetical protein AVDCRST_MAG73-3052, partial [uncultured Thermomicrobiales bacterium]